MSETHHRFQNSITIDIIGGHIDIKHVLDCQIGIREDINIECEQIKIEGLVLPNGTQEVKAYRKGTLIKHIVGEKVLFEMKY
jgi:hypothetical protein